MGDFVGIMVGTLVGRRVGGDVVGGTEALVGSGEGDELGLSVGGGADGGFVRCTAAVGATVSWDAVGTLVGDAVGAESADDTKVKGG